MNLYYDLHIHTALSPCADNDMTPNNIVNMARLKGLDIIAITDHNSCKNVAACMKCAADTGLTVVPGMEIETCEEVHMLAFFDDTDSLGELEEVVKKSLPNIKNRRDIFGDQFIMDSDDNVVGEIDNLLVTATSLSVDSATNIVRTLGGVIVPAHIDKDAYSILSNLGFIPDIGITAFEIKNPQKKDAIVQSNGLADSVIIHDSDAHFLWDIHESDFCIDMHENNAANLLEYLNKIH